VNDWPRIAGPLPLRPAGAEWCLRAHGECRCDACGLTYYRHPPDVYELSNDGEPFLRVLCDGTRVKL
jgi:hypothetical protein